MIDWTHRAVHETTVVSKRLIQAFYDNPPSYSYWDSCHNGGRQGLTEAQLYPEDFDGIVAEILPTISRTCKPARNI